MSHLTSQDPLIHDLIRNVYTRYDLTPGDPKRCVLHQSYMSHLTFQDPLIHDLIRNVYTRYDLTPGDSKRCVLHQYHT
jgi:bifunctional DNase/RNase